MKLLYATSQDILNCDPMCVKHHLLAGCFNNSCSRNYCSIKQDVEALKFINKSEEKGVRRCP